jgi:long-subunit fatty acid transport protein
MMTKLLFLFLLNLTFGGHAFAAFTNYNSILIGEKAAGMGGAYSALVDDPSAAAFYNPATLARMKGSSLSAAVSVYTKSDIKFGNLQDFSKAPLEMNQGTFTAIPTSSGTVYTFGNFAFSISIVTPDFYSYDGEIESTEKKSHFLHELDESLWVGGSLALNISPDSSLGITMYYTSRTFQRINTIKETTGTGVSTDIVVTNEEKNITNNSLVYVLGYFKKLTPNLNMGLSYRLPSLEISGKASYTQFRVSTQSGLITDITQSDLLSETNIPQRISLGFSYKYSGKLTMSAEIQHFESTSYDDIISDVPVIQERIVHKPVTNFHLGFEYLMKSWLIFRGGAYSNNTSAPSIPNNPTRKYQDKISMWGFSSQFAFLTSPQSSVTLGGYYSGGKGNSAQFLGDKYIKISKSIQYFTFLVGTSYNF